jgi:hypothetical protein
VTNLVDLLREIRAALDSRQFIRTRDDEYNDYEIMGLCQKIDEALAAPEPKSPHTYEAALGEVWKALGQLSPATVNNDAVNKIVEAAYYAAENALYKAGQLKLVDGTLTLSENRGAKHE